MADSDTVYVVVTDTNVIINFSHIGRLDLLGALPGLKFIIPEHVMEEITDEKQNDAIKQALDGGWIEPVTITDAAELKNYAELHRTMGQGEAACLAIAEHRGYLIASDEKRVFRRTVHERLGNDRLLTTPDLIVHAIRTGLTTVAEADQWKDKLQDNRFTMQFKSFAELV